MTSDEPRKVEFKFTRSVAAASATLALLIALVLWALPLDLPFISSEVVLSIGAISGFVTAIPARFNYREADRCYHNAVALASYNPLAHRPDPSNKPSDPRIVALDVAVCWAAVWCAVFLTGGMHVLGSTFAWTALAAIGVGYITYLLGDWLVHRNQRFYTSISYPNR